MFRREAAGKPVIETVAAERYAQTLASSSIGAMSVYVVKSKQNVQQDCKILFIRSKYV
jgi:hypothetical protein